MLVSSLKKVNGVAMLEVTCHLWTVRMSMRPMTTKRHATKAGMRHATIAGMC